jgi:drug/metabolite transporter (DMT)-like permease
MSSATITPAIKERPAKTTSSKTVAELLMLVTTFCWASNIVAGKEALQGFGPLALAQLRMSLAALLYGTLFFLRRGWPKLHLTARQWLLLGLMGFTGITLNQICFLGGLARTSVTHTGLIQAVGPIMVFLLSALIGRESITLQNCTGMVIAFVGVAILITSKSGSGNGAHWTGDLILLAAGASFALYTILMKDASCDYDALTLSTLVFGLGAVLLMPFCIGSVTAVEWEDVPLRAWVGLAYMVFFGSVVAYLIYAFALGILSASKAAAFAYLQPVLAVALGVWLIGEHVTPGAFAGGGLILLGVYITERQRAGGHAPGAAKDSDPARKVQIWDCKAFRGLPEAHRLATSLLVTGHECYTQIFTQREYCQFTHRPPNAFSHTGDNPTTRCSRDAAPKYSSARAGGQAWLNCCSPNSGTDQPGSVFSHRDDA